MAGSCLPTACAVFFPKLPVDLTRLDSKRLGRRPDARTPFVLTRTDHQRELVASCCERAWEKGVRHGMTAADARALLGVRPAPVVGPIDDARVGRALRRLAVRGVRLTPIVSLDPPDGLFMDLRGCERLYRGLPRLVKMIESSYAKLGVEGQVAAAPTFAAAWALARAGRTGIFQAAEADVAVDALPLEGLRLDSAVIEQLALVGVTTIGQLRALPRASLADRYGPDVLRRLDQLSGFLEEPLTPVTPREPMAAGLSLDGPTDRLDSVEAMARSLLGEVTEKLATRGAGCRRLDVTLARADLPPLVLTVRASAPTRDPKHLWALIAPRVAAAQLGFGVTGVKLRARRLCRTPHEQAARWVAPAVPPADVSLGRLVDAMNARFGPGRVRRLVPVASHRPERSFTAEPVVELIPGVEIEECGAGLDRPSRLLDPPRPIEVMLLLPDGPVAGVRHRGAMRRCASCLGPERISPEWWRLGEDLSTRDYFIVTTEEGRRLWIYHDDRRDLWRLHGEWA